MIRVPVALLGLAAWLAGALGLRAWWGGKAYLTQVVGSEELAERLIERMIEQTQSVLLDMGPWTLLLAFSVAISAALVLLVLWPADLLMARLAPGRRGRVLVGIGLGAGATAAALLSVHPLLSMPSVPEGPRTVLNYACEAAGYGWINAIAYIGGIGTGAAFAWMGRPAAPKTDVSAAEPKPDDSAPDPEPDAPATTDNIESDSNSSESDSNSSEPGTSKPD